MRLSGGKSEFPSFSVRSEEGNTLNRALEGREYLTGRNFTVVDAYCFVVVGWSKWLNISLEPYKNIQTYLQSVAQWPAVQKVLKDEGLLE